MLRFSPDFAEVLLGETSKKSLGLHQISQRSPLWGRQRNISFDSDQISLDPPEGDPSETLRFSQDVAELPAEETSAKSLVFNRLR